MKLEIDTEKIDDMIRKSIKAYIINFEYKENVDKLLKQDCDDKFSKYIEEKKKKIDLDMKYMVAKEIGLQFIQNRIEQQVDMIVKSRIKEIMKTEGL